MIYWDRSMIRGNLMPLVRWSRHWWRVGSIVERWRLGVQWCAMRHHRMLRKLRVILKRIRVGILYSMAILRW